MTQAITHISVNVEDFKAILQSVQNKSDVMGIDEAADLTKLKPSYLRKMTSNRTIPFYKSAADGKTLYFSRKELEEWCLKNHFKPLYQLADEHIENLGNKKSTF